MTNTTTRRRVRDLLARHGLDAALLEHLPKRLASYLGALARRSERLARRCDDLAAERVTERTRREIEELRRHRTALETALRNAEEETRHRRRFRARRPS